MTHDQYQEQISRLLDNDLHVEESTSLFTHLAACQECREFLQSCLEVRSGLAADALTSPASVDRKLHQQFSSLSASMPGTLQSFSSRRVTLRLPVFTLLLCVIVAGVVLLLSGRSPFHEPQTIYVTRLPAVVVTDGTESAQPKN